MNWIRARGYVPHSCDLSPGRGIPAPGPCLSFKALISLSVLLLFSCALPSERKEWEEFPGDCKLAILNEIDTSGFTSEEMEAFSAIDEMFAWYREQEMAGRPLSTLEVFPRMEQIVSLGRPAVAPLLAIIRMGNRHSIDQIWERPEISYYRMAALMLGRLKATEAVDELMIMASRKGLRESRLRAPAIKALGEIGDQRAVPVVQKALEDHSDQVRKAAKEALERLKRSAR